MIFEEKKIWIFLDEINTCKSMGLITELRIHSCQGNKLKENIIFITACNPYKQAKENSQEKIGMDINQAKNKLKN